MAPNTGSDPSLSVAFREHVRPCIDLIDKLRAFGLDTDVALPSVVVIGDQSAGKSSVLEAISGVQLPRGSGIVTRCPLELRLKSLSNQDQWKSRITYKAHGSEVVRDITKPVDVGEEVKRAQNDLAGTRKGISDELITLEIESANIPDLTLIDLPGITRVAVEDQPQDIGIQIKRLINHYIQKEHTIILAVVPANVDIATTEALQMAKEADPPGQRTLGVITKPDLVDKGTESEIIAVVTNQRYQLNKGYTMVKCRGQQAINDGQTLQEATDEEKEYFTNHEQFKELESSLFGVCTLAQKLTYVLVDHIKNCTPKLKQVIGEKLVETRKELDRIGVGLPTDINEKRMFLVKMVSNFAAEIIHVSNGEYADHQALLRLLSRCRKEFDKFGERIAQCKPGEGDHKLLCTIAKQLESHRGRELPRFMKFQVCESLIRDYLLRFIEPANDCLQNVNQLTEFTLSCLASQNFDCYPSLERQIKAVIDDLRQEAQGECDNALRKIFEIEKLVYTQDNTYTTELDELLQRNSPQAATPAVSGQASGFTFGVASQRTPTNNFDEAKSMMTFVCSYLQVATRRLADVVPMTIRYHLLNQLPEEIKNRLLVNASGDDMLNLLCENKTILQRREMLKQRQNRLKLASKELAKF